MKGKGKFSLMIVLCAAVILSSFAWPGVNAQTAYAAETGNLAQGKPVTASSSLPQHPPVYMTDGSHNTMWSTSDTGWRSSPYADEWAMVDLGEVKDVSRWVVYHAAHGDWSTKDFQLEYSTDNETGPWETADTVVGNTYDITDRILPASVQARYVRLHVTKKTADGVDWPAVRIDELLLYSQAAIIPDLAASPAPGTVTKGTKVALTSSLGTASIYYTIDGSDPETSPTRLKYSEPLAVDFDVNLKAIAIDELGGGKSEAQTFAYIVPQDDLSQFSNLALGATATMTVPAGWGNVAQRAIDGNNGTYAQPEQFVLWDLIVDLGTKQPVNYAVLRKNPDHVNFINKFTIDVSDDGTNWTTVAEEQANDDLKDRLYKFPATETRYVRLHQIEKTGSAAAVWEFELYNTAVTLPVDADIPPGTVASGSAVKLSSPQQGATIYYTTDGSDPKTSETRQTYEQPVVLQANAMQTSVAVKAYAATPGKTDSQVKTFVYQVVPITATPPAGYVPADTDVVLTSTVQGASIYYTTDGTDPLTSPTKRLYADPIRVGYDMVVKAYAADPAEMSPVVTLPYTISQDETNVALNKTASASSEDPSGSAANAFDGNAATAWIAGNTNSGNWLQVDLGGSYDLSGTKVVWSEANKNVKYRIEASSDALHWYTFVDKTNIADRVSEQQDSFLQASRRYIRITVTGLELGSKAGIKEFEVRGRQSVPLPQVPVGPETNGWPRPVIAPLPSAVPGVSEPVVSLNGTWKFSQNPAQGFWRNSTDASGWSDVKVPANVEVLGFDIRGPQGGDWFPKTNIENAYKKSVFIPQDYDGKKVLLRFEAAFNYARVWVNGHLVREHRGGFTTFDADITEYVTPGESAWITVGLTAETGFVEYQHVRGIIGEVKLFALPESYMTRLHAETTFDDTYTDAVLRVNTGMLFEGGEPGAEVALKLVDPEGHEVPIAPSVIPLTASQPEAFADFPVAHPRKWDAEHPNLYTLEAVVKVNGETVQTVTRKIGFRTIQVAGNKMLVNGKEVKLRGVNWHQSTPLTGVAADRVHDRESLVKLKAANVNYIRASHWPQYEYVLDIADELGFYVEQENSIMFVNDFRTNDPRYLNNYMGQFSETIEKDRSHPSIVIWSLGNESSWGSNLTATHDYAKQIDPSRPVKFSFGVNAPANYNDLFSIHYTPYGERIGSHDKPELYDEYAHNYVYYGDWIDNDPAYRDFYGEAIKRLWGDLYRTQGALGGAIWHSRDLFFYGPNGRWPGFQVSWGILDEWNREKPEYWNVKKAYSPVRIVNNFLPEPGPGKQLSIPVENRFNHTNLNELMIEWSAGNKSGTMAGPSIEPMSKGALVIPVKHWKLGDSVHLKFYRSGQTAADGPIDEYELTIGQKSVEAWEPEGKAPKIEETGSELTVSGKDFKLIFNKTTGLIREGIYNGQSLLKGGPFLDMGYTAQLAPWTFTSINGANSGKEAVVSISGKYGNTGVDYQLRIDSKGLIQTTYTVTNPPSDFDAVGVSFDVAAAADRITWDRDGQWSYYPDDQIGRNAGTAYKNRSHGEEAYGVKPDWAWSEDEKPGQGTNDFRASKTNFYYASLIDGATGNRITAQGDGSGSVQATVNPDGTIRFHIRSIWSHPAAFPGWVEANPVRKPISVASGYTGVARIKLDDRDRFEFDYERVPQYLSDLDWVSATTGWSTVNKDSAADGNVLTLFDGKGSRSYDKGVGTHANSEIVYNIAGQHYDRFEAVVGIDQETGGGSVVFQVWADGVKLFDSGRMDNKTPAKPVSVNIAGRSELKLIVADAGNGHANDHGDWADAKLIRSGHR